MESSCESSAFWCCGCWEFFLEKARIPLKLTVEYIHVPILGTADLALLLLKLTAMLLPFTLKQSEVLHQVHATPVTQAA